MLPHDLPPESLRLPGGERESVVYFSGDSLRHHRLGYLIQRRFPGLMKAWWIYAPKESQGLGAKIGKAWQLATKSQTGREALGLLGSGDVRGLADIVKRRIRKGDLRRLGRKLRAFATPDDYADVERQMFGAELDGLRADAEMHPEYVESPDDEAHLARLGVLAPYLIVTFGGRSSSSRALREARGLTINQHAGWSPALKGASAIETAIYHRAVELIGSTIHLVDTQADAGAILRRSTATLHPDDSLAHCFFSVCATGNKMMLEVIDTILHNDEIATFPQPQGGQTLLDIDLSPIKREAIARDMRTGWLADALALTEQF